MTTRRNFIVSLALAPPAIAVPTGAISAVSTAGRGRWEVVMAEHVAAMTAGAEYDRTHVNPLYDAMKAKFGDLCRPETGPLREEYREWCAAHNYEAIIAQSERYTDVESDTRVALLRMPAPDLAALRWKLDETFADGDIALWCDEIADAIRADIVRLMPKGA